VEGSCKYGNETSGSIKSGEVFDYLRDCQFPKKDSAPWKERLL
jgi:hypothetical protein